MNPNGRKIRAVTKPNANHALADFIKDHPEDMQRELDTGFVKNVAENHQVSPYYLKLAARYAGLRWPTDPKPPPLPEPEMEPEEPLVIEVPVKRRLPMDEKEDDILFKEEMRAAVAENRSRMMRIETFQEKTKKTMKRIDLVLRHIIENELKLTGQ